MGISVSPSAIRNESYQAYTPKVYRQDELEQLKKKPTEVITEGDVYRSSTTNFKKLTLFELRHEKLTVNPSKQERIIYSDGSVDNTKQTVAIRDPMGGDDILTFELSKKTIADLKKKFGDSNNFFERGDGILRLNGKAENFVAGWMKDIRENRNYDKADTDGNGRIDGNEAQALTIAFERQKDYDYIGEKLVHINVRMGGDSYQSLGRSADAHHLFETEKEKAENKEKGYTYRRDISSSQYAKFENTVEKELDHTLQMDADLNGIVTLDEGLRDEFGKNYRQKIIDDTQEFHKHLLQISPNLNDSSRLQNHDIGLHGIITEDEEKAQKEAFLKQGLYIKEQMAQNPYFLSDSTSLDTLNTKEKGKSLAQAQGQIGRTIISAYSNMSDTNDAKLTFTASELPKSS